MSADEYKFRLTMNPKESAEIWDRAGRAGVNYNQAGLSSIVRELVSVDDGVVISTTSLVIANVVYDTPQAWPDDGAAPDDVGYNFYDMFSVPTTGYGGRQVEYRATFTDTSSRVTILRGLVDVRAMP